jgi:flagellar biosynthesis/type III secretory pathway protein FliH
MFLQMKFRRKAQAMVSELVGQVIKMLSDNRMVDLHYNLEEKIIEAQREAYNEGYERGKEEVTRKVELFDSSKDEVES